MSERVGNDIPLRFVLKPIIADGACRSQRLIDVARFEHTFLLGVMSLSAGLKVFSHLSE